MYTLTEDPFLTVDDLMSCRVMQVHSLQYSWVPQGNMTSKGGSFTTERFDAKTSK